MTRTTFLVALLAGALGAQPKLTNGKTEERAVQGGLTADVQRLVANQSEPAWIGYAVPIVRAQGTRCWNNGGNNSPVSLEPPKSLYVMFRIEQNKVDKIRTFTPDCQLDGGGTTLYWLTGVKPSDSVALLKGYTKDHDGAVTAIAMHDDPAAEEYLIALARDDKNPRTRGRALQWLGEHASRKSVGEIQNAIDNDPDTEVRRKAVSALSRLPKDEGVPLLISVAKTNRYPDIRKQAVQALARSNDPRALTFFEEVLKK
jgi:hypothetical protein